VVPGAELAAIHEVAAGRCAPFLPCRHRVHRGVRPVQRPPLASSSTTASWTASSGRLADCGSVSDRPRYRAILRNRTDGCGHYDPYGLNLDYAHWSCTDLGRNLSVPIRRMRRSGKAASHPSRTGRAGAGGPPARIRPVGVAMQRFWHPPQRPGPTPRPDRLDHPPMIPPPATLPRRAIPQQRLDPRHVTAVITTSPPACTGCSATRQSRSRRYAPSRRRACYDCAKAGTATLQDRPSASTTTSAVTA
jgi:hypothetical protein